MNIFLWTKEYPYLRKYKGDSYDKKWQFVHNRNDRLYRFLSVQKKKFGTKSFPFKIHIRASSRRSVLPKLICSFEVPKNQKKYIFIFHIQKAQFTSLMIRRSKTTENYMMKCRSKQNIIFNRSFCACLMLGKLN